MWKLLALRFAAHRLYLYRLSFLKIKRKISAKSYFQDIILEIGFLLERSKTALSPFTR